MLDLPFHFGISQVGDVYHKMESLLNSDSELIEIQGEDIESIDSAAIQLLTIFIIKAKADGKSIKWLNTSEKLRLSVNTLGINNFLELSS